MSASRRGGGGVPPSAEAAEPAFRRAVLAEFIGTFFLLWLTEGCVVFTNEGGISTARELQLSVMAGLTVTVLVYTLGPISGAHMNPSVTLSAALQRKLSPLRAGAYALAQFAGAAAGAASVRALSPVLFDRAGGGANYIHAGATAREALGVEFAMTFMLCLFAAASSDPARAAAFQSVTPLVAGLVVTAANFLMIPVDSCSINPARTWGVSVVTGDYSDHWVFWLGPLLGATAAALVYQYLLVASDDVDVVAVAGPRRGKAGGGGDGGGGDDAADGAAQ